MSLAPGLPAIVAVIGNGIIGHGVAQVFATAGAQVRLIGRNAGSLAQALANVRAGLDLFVAEEMLTPALADAALARITTATALDAAADAGLVVEALPEDMALKRATFRALDGLCGPDTILSTSSGHSASEVHQDVTNRSRVIAAQFWFPPTLLPLVEVVGSPQTDPAVITRTCDALRAAGKEPVVIDKEVPGFIGNRIQFAALREAWALWASGAASAEAIDAVVRHSIGRRLAVTGPLESADMGGLQVMVPFARFLQPDLDVNPLPPPALDDLVAQGHLGPSTGRGVHDWTGPGRNGAALLKARQEELLRWLKVDAARRRPA